ncbi:YjbF family lipoprotein [Aliiglaciecola sp. 3_MG-2023]|uniref:YjbF family lipoprotein n=1 Tax=Aliiglaciecola sp. 3_MG-2023 TaxID=3062644 RepID=UPI0026E1D992|nr:YjbF family lipoprotein [Aliiglaciecola sp. 3_MG-2023]MDO6692977.1 YjbF family lipoprotein [Aliiglaciecola sp. 3_MG-2023]
MKIIFSLLICSLVFLSACSSTQRAYQQNIKLYFSSKDNVTLNKESVLTSPVDLLYIKAGERPYVTLALAFIENSQYKWVSADDAVMITQNGRLVRTLGLDNNLIYVDNLDNDPMASKSNITENATWNSYLDLDPQQYGVKLHSSFSRESNIPLAILEQQFLTIKITEYVTTQDALGNTENWQNEYWYHMQSGQLLRSSQQFSGLTERYDMQYVSRAMRLLETAND